MRSQTYADRLFRQTLHALRTECPVSMGVPVRVRRVDLVPERCSFTTTSRNDKSINITVARRVCENGRVRRATASEQMESLMHEWAHAMGWTPYVHHTLTDHDASWGVNYAKVYAAVVED